MFPEDLQPDETGLVGWGGDLSRATLLEAYSKGIFPWSGDPPIPWYSPDPRLVLFPSDFHASRTLRRVLRRGELEVRYDTAFREVMQTCAAMPRPGQEGTWITDAMIDAYCLLASQWIAHSVEVWSGDELVGGLYGVTLGRAFFGESMFSHIPNGSKLALWHLCRNLVKRRFHLVDCQQVTRHLISLGARAIPRREFQYRLQRALIHSSHHYRWTPWSALPTP